MAIHQRPTADVIELVRNYQELPNTAISRLPRGLITPAHVRYGVIEDSSDKALLAENIFGQPFALGASDESLPVDTASADLIVVPHQVNDSILERLLRMAKPGPVVVVAVSPSPVFNSKGFEVVTTISAGTERLFLYKRTDNDEKKLPRKIGNGTPREEIAILEPIVKSRKLQLFSKKLQDLLENESYAVDTITGVTEANDVVEKTCISLLELDKSILENLREPDFQGIRKLMTSCKRLIWITCGDDPLLRMVDGLARCVNAEMANIRFQVLHLSSEGLQQGPSLAARILESSETTADNEFREQNGLLQVPRMYTSPKENKHVRNHLEDSTRLMSFDDDDTPFRLKIGKPGLLDSLHFIRDESVLLTPLADDELELQVKATGINFRDVMASMGLVPVTGLGQEASGIVLRAGSRAAKSFQVGDRVSALSTGGTHATRMRCDSRVTAKMPNTLSFEEGAAAPMVHATAYYTLIKLAKLHRGQSVLIHAAAGGVGQAAVQLAKYLGLVIYVTVGAEDKRRFVTEHYGISEEHIFNSRDSSFAQGIRRVTGGRGVDCVLNSLSGELLRVSWTCLATFGTFVEIGMRDITDNMRLDMRPFGKSATFTFFDIPTLIKEDPAALGEALDDVFKLFQDGVLRVPYPLTVYPVGQVQDAFRIMQQGKHRGKLVLSFDEKDTKEAPILCKAKNSLKLDANSTYLFIGGLGGLGSSLAKELVASGARHIAFLSRSGDTKTGAKAIIKELAALGAQVKTFCSDVADQASFLAAMDQCTKQLPPIKGVIQMAVVLRDSIVENMSFDDWTIPLQPKVQGTRNLHQYFNHERPLDFMIFGSSISGLIGNPGQAQYCAGNTYQDALAHYRRAQGLKAVSVNLGIMLDVGILAESDTHNFKQWEDVLGIRPPAFHALMKSVINGQQNKRGGKDCPAQICVGLGHADIIATHRLPNPPWFGNIQFGPLTVPSTSASTSSDDEGAGASVASKLAKVANNNDHVAAVDIITGAIVNKLADILRILPSEIDPTRPLYSYGVDSLVALEVRNWITRELKANMALLDILAAEPMETFAAKIALKSKLMTA
jgi:NADPH:quinone reductase-like Zn-dependent oxidoreductase/NAD(P)-dependent dehydrogenase (short-subunit alcohol dehydrogenase family)